MVAALLEAERGSAAAAAAARAAALAALAEAWALPWRKRRHTWGREASLAMATRVELVAKVAR